MAELCLKIKDKSADSDTYKDGDILHCWTVNGIRCVNAYLICNFENFGFTRDGLRPESLARKLRQHTHQYRCDRISDTEYVRTDLFNGEQLIFSSTPNIIKGYVKLEEWLRRRLAHPKHVIFGPKGSEFWFTGRKKYDSTRMNLVWNDIETDSKEREVDWLRHPLGRLDKKDTLIMLIDEPESEQAAKDLEAPEMLETLDVNTNKVIVEIKRKRKHWVDYKNLSQFILSPTDQIAIQDKTKDTDMRRPGKELSIVNDVILKSLTLPK